MNTTRVLILGTLLDDSMNGYQVRRSLETMGADQWGNVAFGSIYHGLGKMADEGLLDVVESGKGGKTVYAITEAGRFEFHRLLMTLWYEIRPIVDPFQVAMVFMDRLERPQLKDALQVRSEELTRAIAMTHRALGSKQAFGAPRHVDENLRLNIGMLDAQLTWVRQAIQKVEEGDLP
ncbi:PadR family transcriptional regulator [Nonomuraea sp. NPDC059194]|uniref:PadR family transcriptional regulator n=1 Tax=Nonomuraea sp. NPDC059194 TaxID=3346764 RepID=UPI0036A3A4D6